MFWTTPNIAMLNHFQGHVQSLNCQVLPCLSPKKKNKNNSKNEWNQRHFKPRFREMYSTPPKKGHGFLSNTRVKTWQDCSEEERGERLNKNHSLVYIFKKTYWSIPLKFRDLSIRSSSLSPKTGTYHLKSVRQFAGLFLKIPQKPYAQSTQSGVQYILV